MAYRFFLPSPALSLCIDSYYIVEESFLQPQPVKITPAGTSGIVFRYGGRLKVYNVNHEGKELEDHFIFGPTTSYCLLEPAGEFKMLGAHFTPTGFYRLFGISVKEITDQGVYGASVLGEAIREVSEKIQEAATDEQKINQLEQYFLSQLRIRTPRSDWINQAVGLIQQYHGDFPVTDIARLLRVSRRTLERKFLEEIGMYPKIFSAIVRFNSSLTYLESQLPHSLTDITYTCGYYDQAHFIKNFKQFSGETPRHFADSSLSEASKIIQLSCRKRRIQADE
jgi:AraC-like DNA-binding protein